MDLTESLGEEWVERTNELGTSWTNERYHGFIFRFASTVGNVDRAYFVTTPTFRLVRHSFEAAVKLFHEGHNTNLRIR